MTRWIEITPDDRSNWPKEIGIYPVLCYYEGEYLDGYQFHAPAYWEDLFTIREVDEDGRIYGNGFSEQEWENVVAYLPKLPPRPMNLP